MSRNRFSNVIGFDDAPFTPRWEGNVTVVGTVFARLRLNGVLVGEVEKDGTDAAAQLAQLVKQSKFFENVQLIMLQGIALGGFNVVDVFQLHEQLALPILVVARRQPDMDAIQTGFADPAECLDRLAYHGTGPGIGRHTVDFREFGP